MPIVRLRRSQPAASVQPPAADASKRTTILELCGSACTTQGRIAGFSCEGRLFDLLNYSEVSFIELMTTTTQSPGERLPKEQMRVGPR